MDDKTLLTPEEIKKEKRKKQLAIIKASNEMLEYAKNTVLNSDKIDNISRTERVQDIEQAIEENKFKAQTYLHADLKEVEDSTYAEASEEEKRKYEERLKKKGITEDTLTRMDMATVSTNDSSEKKSKRTHTVKRKRNKTVVDEQEEEIVRLPNEEELMRKSMATREKIEERIKNNTKQEDSLTKDIKEIISEKKVKNINEIKETATSNENNINEKEVASTTVYDFDFSTIPDYIQYDMIPLPSEGKCYPINSPLRCGRVPVAMLTASDENIIASPNMYRDGKIIDVILSRKILDKRININDLVKGDRDAIVLWLRATGYDTDFPIIATHPVTGKKYEVNVHLDELKYKDFNLKNDKDGNFTYKTLNGDEIKFNFTTQLMDDTFKKNIIENNIDVEKYSINKYLNNINECLVNINDMSDDDINDIKGCIEDIKEILSDNIKDTFDEDKVFNSAITEQMILYTKSVNGNADKDYIRNYIENMRSNDAYQYRNLVNNNKPGVDFELTINVPESDGGGSFNTFLKLGNDVFINI